MWLRRRVDLLPGIVGPPLQVRVKGGRGWRSLSVRTQAAVSQRRQRHPCPLQQGGQYKRRMTFQEVFDLIHFFFEVVIDLNVWKYFVEHNIT